MSADVARIGPCPWPVVIELEGDPHDRAVVGQDFDQKSWDGLPPQMMGIYQSYLHERLRRRGSDIPRAAATFRNIMLHFGPDADPTQLKIAHWHEYEDHRYAQGVKAPTVRRELTYHQAAMNHALHRERIEKVPYIEKPSPEVLSERRAATEEEVRRLFQTPMPFRIRMFFVLAYWTGHRAQAIEQLTWDRVNFEERLIDFNVPGKRLTNKRRNPAFPIPDGLYPRLVAAYERHLTKCPDDPYVIGRGCTTYQGCKDAWKRAGVNVDGLCRHAFRKTFVTELVKAGEKLEVAATLIADRPETAGKHYFKLDRDHLRKAVNKREAA